MIRFKVVRASKILLILSAVILAAAIGIIVYSAACDTEDHGSAASLVMSEEAKIRTVFASSDKNNSKEQFSWDPGSSESAIDIQILDTEVEEERDMPRIFIYHTHTHEAYEQNSLDPYVAIEAWRTTDADHSVIRVGEELAELLRSYGFRVIHDTNDHEGNALQTANERSLETLESCDDRFDLYIDLHRDAYSEGLQMRHTASDGTEMAQIMLLIGNGEGFSEKPYYTENHLFAKKLTQRIDRICPGICREVLVKDGRYNQHVDFFSVLIEIGHNRNSLSEALKAVRPLAEGIYDLMITKPDAVLENMLNEKAG